jgi:hypothetical protein
MDTQQKFDRAVKIVSGLPKEDAIKPTPDEQLVVSFRKSHSP